MHYSLRTNEGAVHAKWTKRRAKNRSLKITQFHSYGFCAGAGQEEKKRKLKNKSKL